MNPGIYSDIPNSQYHHGGGISKSGLDLIAKSPAHYQAVIQGLVKREPTTAQAIGTAFHMLVLEPELFWQKYAEPLKRDKYPNAIDSSALPEMIAELNKTRMPKLSTTGDKDTLISRIISEIHANDTTDLEVFQGMKLAELRHVIDGANQHREGLLKTSGTTEQLTATLRENGVQFTLWSEIKAQYAADNADREILTDESFYMLMNMSDAVMAHPIAKKLLKGGPTIAEHSVYWTDPETGQACKCRPDSWRYTKGILIDLKTTTDASPTAFAKSVANWRYHVQDAFYVDGVNHAIKQSGNTDFEPITRMVFIAVEKDACVVNGESKGVGVYVLDEDSLEEGRRQYKRDLATYVQCCNENKWPGYSQKTETISIPNWGYKTQTEETN